MTITLYKYYGERNRIDKESMLTQVLTTSGKFKADVSVLNPVLLLSLPIEGTQYVTDENNNVIDDVVVNVEDGSIIDFNYLYIAEFRRFYFVNSMVVGSGTLLTLGCEVDPLMSFKDQILDNEALIERNEFEYDEFLEDVLLPLKLTRDVTETTPASGSLVNTEFKTEPEILNFDNVVVSYAAVNGYRKTIDAPLDSDLPNINTEMFGDSTGTQFKLLDNPVALTSDLLGQYSTLSTFFKSLVAMPFNVRQDADINSYANIELYKFDEGTNTYVTTTLTARCWNVTPSSSYRVVADFVLPDADDFLDLNPFTHYEIYLPFVGYQELNFNQMQGDRIIVYYVVDYADGSATCYVYDMTKERLVFSQGCQVGVRLSLSSSNLEELQKQREAIQNNMALSLVGSGIGLIAATATGNLIAGLGSGLSAISSIVQANNQKAMLFARTQSTASGSHASLYAPMQVKLKVTKAQVLDGFNLSKFAHQYGRPLNQIRTLSSLSGFTQVASIHLEGCTATDAEKRMIVSSLLQGVHL